MIKETWTSYGCSFLLTGYKYSHFLFSKGFPQVTSRNIANQTSVQGLENIVTEDEVIAPIWPQELLGGRN